jgi:hypothetical protein
MKHLGTKRIETDRLILRKFRMDDVQGRLPGILVGRLIPMLRQHKRLLSRVDEYKKLDCYQWCIELKELGAARRSLKKPSQ